MRNFYSIRLHEKERGEGNADLDPDLVANSTRYLVVGIPKPSRDGKNDFLDPCYYDIKPQQRGKIDGQTQNEIIYTKKLH